MQRRARVWRVVDHPALTAFNPELRAARLDYAEAAQAVGASAAPSTRPAAAARTARPCALCRRCSESGAVGEGVQGCGDDGAIFAWGVHLTTKGQALVLAKVLALGNSACAFKYCPKMPERSRRNSSAAGSVMNSVYLDRLMRISDTVTH